MSQYYLGVDIGTSESKATLIDEGCTPIWSKSIPHTMENPHPGWYEMDADSIWWGEFCQLTRAVLTEADISATEIGCVGASTLGCDCVPVDRYGQALAPAILYGIDSRTAPEIGILQTLFGSTVEATFGHPLCTSDVAPKILWFKHNMPDVWSTAYKFLTGSSYICARLTGKFVIDSYLAEDFLPLYDLTHKRVNESACKIFCQADQLADIAQATEIIGSVTTRAARETGLVADTPVLVGTGDSGAEALSTGVFQPGDLMIQLGSSCYFVYLSDHPVTEGRLWPSSFIIPGIYSVCAGTNTAGTLIKWLRDELYADAVRLQEQGGDNAFSVMARDANTVAPGANGLMCLPYFAGERTPINDPLARGAFFGLTTRHTRADIVRSALEGIGCSIAQHLTILKENNLPIRKVMCVGGGTKNETWLQCVADMLEQPIQTAGVTLGASYGDALMALLAKGPYNSWADIAPHVKPKRTITPNQSVFKTYRQRKEQFKELYESTKLLAHELSQENAT